MPRQATGNVVFSRGHWYARVTLGPNNRRLVLLPSCGTEKEAKAKAALLAELVAKLRASGHDNVAMSILERAATREGKALDDVRRVVDGLCG
ncbi:MAG TPA: DNA integration/recombination/inversion protein, partial [Byssovorax sp.]